MSSVHIEGLNHVFRVNHALIDELDERLVWHDKPRSYRLLMAVLHTIRAQAAHGRAADPGVHFSVRACGRYFEESQLPMTYSMTHITRDLIEQVALWFKPDPIKDPTAVILTVFDLLAQKVSESPTEREFQFLPEKCPQAWPNDAPGQLPL